MDPEKFKEALFFLTKEAEVQGVEQEALQEWMDSCKNFGQEVFKHLSAEQKKRFTAELIHAMHTELAVPDLKYQLNFMKKFLLRWYEAVAGDATS